ncbi:MAG TPA: bile acid:sodium symporter family protein [Gemmataceae bacterium]|nr:bile acid:sodium symporter family protein [Gemmataceae bacterium]
MFSHYADYEYLLARIQLVLFMLGMGATLRPMDFLGIALRPRYLLVGAVCQFMLTPVLAVIINCWMDLEAGIAVGLILVSAMPGGQMSKLFTYLARGNVALSITLTAAGTLASLVTVPLLLELLAEEHLRQSNFEMPLGLVVRDVAIYLLLPLLVGMTVGRFAPARRMVFSKSCIRVGLVFVGLMIVGSLGSGQIQLTSYGWKVPLAIIVFCVGAMQLSMLPFRLLGWPRSDAVAVGIEVTMRNMNLALLLKTRLFPGDDPVGNGVLFVILYYAGTAILAGLPLTLRYRRMALRADEEAATK